jgi:hypothetical protein
LINSAGDFFDDHIEVYVVKVEAGSLVNEASPNLIEVDWLARPVPLYNILNTGLLGLSVLRSLHE